MKEAMLRYSTRWAVKIGFRSDSADAEAVPGGPSLQLADDRPIAFEVKVIQLDRLQPRAVAQRREIEQLQLLLAKRAAE